MMSMPVPGITQMGGNPQYPNFGVQTGMPQSGMGQMPPWLMSMFQQMNPGGPGGPQSMPIPGMQMPGMGGMERDGGMGGMGRGRGGRMSGFQGPRPRPPWAQGGMMPYNDLPWGQAGGPPMPGGVQSLPIPGMQAPPQNPMMQMPMPQYGRYGGG